VYAATWLSLCLKGVGSAGNRARGGSDFHGMLCLTWKTH
jgi:hypothetical protein